MRFQYVQFNEVREWRGAPAARVAVVDDECENGWIWMGREHVRLNIRDFGPHPALVKAAQMYGMNVVALVALHRSNDEVEQFYRPLEPERVNGWWSHPDHPSEEELSPLNMEAWLNVLGLTYRIVSLENDDSPGAQEARKAYFENSETDISAWDPQPPKNGNVWQLVSIHDTEDGPVAVFIAPAFIQAQLLENFG